MKTLFIKNNIKFLLALFLAAAITTSCKKLIQIPPNPNNEIPTSTVFADSADVMSAVAGIYNNFDVTDNGLSFHCGAITVYTGLAGDELVSSASNQPINLQYYDNQVLSNNYQNSNTWSNAYNSLYQINACLAGISSGSAISASLKQQLIGEIKVVRALYNFNLVNLYGGVPLPLSTNYKVNESLARASVDTVYGHILADLTTAQKMLTTAYPSAGRFRPNLYVADALLAKVYLYRGQWQNAENEAENVINSGLYSLNTDLNTVFLDGSNEAIWQLPADGSFNQTPEGYAFIPYANNVVPDYSLTTYLLNAFEPGDQREQDWTATDTVNENGSNVVYYYPFKYKNKRATQLPAEDYMIFRLAEIYLIRAEAEANENKDTQALADLNLIRQRAGLPPSTATTQTDLLNAIMRERRIELFCEWGNRWYDLKRTATINTVLGAEKSGWKATDALFPIPLTQLQSNPFLKQNPGY